MLMHVQQMFYDSSYIYKLIIRKLKNSVPVRHSLSFDSFSLFTFMLQRVKKQKETAGLCTSAGRADDLRRERAVRNAIALQQKRKAPPCEGRERACAGTAGFLFGCLRFRHATANRRSACLWTPPKGTRPAMKRAGFLSSEAAFAEMRCRTYFYNR